MNIILERIIYIDGIKTDYKVTSDGEIISLKNGKRKYLKPQKFRHGYLYVNLWVDGICYRDTIHRLVAKAFISNPYDLPEVNHIDGDKENNCVDNLEWASSKYNTHHAWNNNLCTNYGEKSHLNKYKEDTIVHICELLMSGMQPKEISKITGLSQTMISDIREKKIWRHVTKRYKFPKRSIFNYNSKYSYELKNEIAELCIKGYNNKYIRETLDLPHTKAIKNMIDRIRKKVL